MYLGDIRLGDTLDLKFCTVNTSGVPTQLAGTPVISAYPDNSTTELTAGITLTVDFDGRTGLNNVRVVASGGNGYATATNYQLVITTGTVSGSSVVGYVVGHFSIEKRSALMPVTAGRTIEVDAAGIADADVRQWLGSAAATPTVAGVPEVDVTHFSGTAGTFASGRPEVNTSHVAGTAQTAGDIIADTNDIQARLPAALVSGRMDASVGDLAAAALDDFFNDRRSGILDWGTAQAVAAGSITLQAGHGLGADMAKDSIVVITSATTGRGQPRVITGLAGDVASISPNWGITPTGTVTYAVIGGAPLTTAMETRLAELDTANLPTDVAGVQSDTNDIQTRLPAALVSGRMDSSVGAMAANVVTAAAIATNAIDADALSDDAVDAIADEVYEGTLTHRQIVRLILAAVTGKSSGFPAGPAVYRDNADTKARITATVDANGNRSAVTLDAT